MTHNWEEATWTQQHRNGYAEHVFSITHDDDVRAKALDELYRIKGGALEILLPACGSVSLLEREIAQKITKAKRILCTDFAGVIAIPSAQNDNPRIVYEARDSRALGLKNVFDAVVVMNSVVGSTAGENKKMLRSFAQATKPGGRLIGFFPTVFCALDLCHTIADRPRAKGFRGLINARKNSVLDPAHNARQVFFSPINLRKALIEAGFRPHSMDVHFMDSPVLKKESERLYGLEPTDPPLYELFVVAEKRVP